MNTLANSHVLETADAILRENGINAERNILLTLSGKILTSLIIRDYSVCYWDTLQKIRSLITFARVREIYSHTIEIEAI